MWTPAWSVAAILYKAAKICKVWENFEEPPMAYASDVRIQSLRSQNASRTHSTRFLVVHHITPRTTSATCLMYVLCLRARRGSEHGHTVFLRCLNIFVSI